MTTEVKGLGKKAVAGSTAKPTKLAKPGEKKAPVKKDVKPAKKGKPEVKIEVREVAAVKPFGKAAPQAPAPAPTPAPKADAAPKLPPARSHAKPAATPGGAEAQLRKIAQAAREASDVELEKIETSSETLAHPAPAKPAAAPVQQTGFQMDAVVTKRPTPAKAAPVAAPGKVSFQDLVSARQTLVENHTAATAFDVHKHLKK